MNLAVFLSALALVESGNNPHAIGHNGERSEYQMIRSVWKQHSGGYSFTLYSTDPVVSKVVANRRLNWICKQGVPRDPFCMALAWHAGVRGFRRACINGPSKEAKDYALRVENTYNDLIAKSKRGLKPSNRP